jgi:hypothetical protein
MHQTAASYAPKIASYNLQLGYIKYQHKKENDIALQT